MTSVDVITFLMNLIFNDLVSFYTLRITAYVQEVFSTCQGCEFDLLTIVKWLLTKNDTPFCIKNGKGKSIIQQTC